MNAPRKNSYAHGFSVTELLFVVAMVSVIAGFVVISLPRGPICQSHHAQESARTSQEYLNRDLINTGDGLNSINNIRVPQNFVTNYLTRNPITNAATPGIINLGLITADPTIHYSLGLVSLDLEDKESAIQHRDLIKGLGDHLLASDLMDKIDRQFLRDARGSLGAR